MQPDFSDLEHQILLLQAQPQPFHRKNRLLKPGYQRILTTYYVHNPKFLFRHKLVQGDNIIGNKPFHQCHIDQEHFPSVLAIIRKTGEVYTLRKGESRLVMLEGGGDSMIEVKEEEEYEIFEKPRWDFEMHDTIAGYLKTRKIREYDESGDEKETEKLRNKCKNKRREQYEHDVRMPCLEAIFEQNKMMHEWEENLRGREVQEEQESMYKIQAYDSEDEGEKPEHKAVRKAIQLETKRKKQESQELYRKYDRFIYLQNQYQDWRHTTEKQAKQRLIENKLRQEKEQQAMNEDCDFEFPPTVQPGEEYINVPLEKYLENNQGDLPLTVPFFQIVPNEVESDKQKLQLLQFQHMQELLALRKEREQDEIREYNRLLQQHNDREELIKRNMNVQIGEHEYQEMESTSGMSHEKYSEYMNQKRRLEKEESESKKAWADSLKSVKLRHRKQIVVGEEPFIGPLLPYDFHKRVRELQNKERMAKRRLQTHPPVIKIVPPPPTPTPMIILHVPRINYPPGQAPIYKPVAITGFRITAAQKFTLQKLRLKQIQQQNSKYQMLIIDQDNPKICWRLLESLISGIEIVGNSIFNSKRTAIKCEIFGLTWRKIMNVKYRNKIFDKKKVYLSETSFEKGYAKLIPMMGGKLITELKENQSECLFFLGERDLKVFKFYEKDNSNRFYTKENFFETVIKGQLSGFTELGQGFFQKERQGTWIVK